MEHDRGAMVLFLDDDPDLRDSLADIVEVMLGEECLLLGSHRELVATDARRVLGCRVAVLDINLGAGAPSGVDAYRWLRELGFPGEIVFFTGHARSHPLVLEATRLDGVQVIEKPVGIDRLQQLLHDGVPRNGAAGGGARS